MTVFNAVVGDIAKCDYDAIVNSANGFLAKGCGVCGAIHKAAGPNLLKECVTKYNGCEVGKAVITAAYNLPCRHVIHAVGPKYFELSSQPQLDPKEKEQQQFDCYQYALRLAKEHGIKTIAFPCMGIGAHGFPEELGVRILINAISDFITKDSQFDVITVYYFAPGLLLLHRELSGINSECVDKALITYDKFRTF